jgi:hypothetical protein
MVDRMRRRVIELSEGRVVRDEATGLYSQRDETTMEFATRLRETTVADEGRLTRPHVPGAADRAAPVAAPEPDFDWVEGWK